LKLSLKIENLCNVRVEAKKVRRKEGREGEKMGRWQGE
jgi:hypothetical protein